MRHSPLVACEMPSNGCDEGNPIVREDLISFLYTAHYIHLPPPHTAVDFISFVSVDASSSDAVSGSIEREIRKT